MSSSNSVFDKRLTPETTIDKVEGVLEHFNLPPRTIAWIRRNLKLIQVALVLLLVTVVTWSLYSSYRERHRNAAATALSLAMTDQQSASRQAAMQAVLTEYGSTPSALWARVELAHLEMKEGKYQPAASAYRGILGDLKNSHPLYPLVLFSLAQAMEADGKSGEASGRYSELATIKGYEHLGFFGMARLEEMQGNLDQALNIYQSFLEEVAGNPAYPGMSEEITAQINRLKARQ